MILNLLPLELTFINDTNIVKYYNEGREEEKIFKRMKSAIGRDVMNYHPPKVHDQIRSLIESLRSGEKDKEEMWYTRGEQMIHITYQSVRTSEGQHMGALEYV